MVGHQCECKLLANVDSILVDECEAVGGMLGGKVIICEPGGPEDKGLVERFTGYLETSFLPGRTFTSPADFNAQLSAWLTDKAIMRMHRTLGCRPFDRLDADRSAMLTLPPVMPRLGWQASTRLPRDHYGRIWSND